MRTRHSVADPQRLTAVRRVLPGALAARASLDRLAMLAATAMESPIALVNLIGSRQHLVGMAGLGEPLATTRELPLDEGYCPATLESGAPVFADDIVALRGNGSGSAEPWLGLRGYAGCPLRDVNGQLIGTLCVADTRPRRWGPRQRRMLPELAHWATNEFELYLDDDRRRRALGALDAAPAAVALTSGLDHVVEYANPAFRAIFGDVPIGKPGAEAMPELPAELFSLMKQVLQTGEPYRATEGAIRMRWPGEQHPRERYFDFSYSAVGSATVNWNWGVLMVAIDVTDRVLARTESEGRAQRNGLLARAGAALQGSLEPEAELRELASVAVPELADVAGVHVLRQPVPPGLTPPLPMITDRVAVAATPRFEKLVEPTQGLRWEHEQDAIVRAIRRSEPSPVPVPIATMLSYTPNTTTNALVDAGLTQLVHVPVTADGLVVAIVWFARSRERAPWAGDDIATVGQLARYAEIALARGMSYQRTRQSALVLQRSMLTPPPSVPGLALAARYQPAGRDEVGGDWYDVFGHDHASEVSVAIGDVVGHDIVAAAAMGQLRATLRALASVGTDDTAAVLRRLAAVNNRLRITPFVTMIYGKLCRGGGEWRLRWASAGHPPPLLVMPGEPTRLLTRSRGTALTGRAGDTAYSEAEVTIPAGATLVLYTDGLVEYRGRDIGDSIEALAARAGAAARKPVEELCDQLLWGSPRSDDIALLAVRVPAVS